MWVLVFLFLFLFLSVLFWAKYETNHDDYPDRIVARDDDS